MGDYGTCAAGDWAFRATVATSDGARRTYDSEPAIRRRTIAAAPSRPAISIAQLPGSGALGFDVARALASRDGVEVDMCVARTARTRLSTAASVAEAGPTRRGAVLAAFVALAFEPTTHEVSDAEIASLRVASWRAAAGGVAAGTDAASCGAASPASARTIAIIVRRMVVITTLFVIWRRRRKPYMSRNATTRHRCCGASMTTRTRRARPAQSLWTSLIALPAVLLLFDDAARNSGSEARCPYPRPACDFAR
jgi:hypothetical protein